MKNQEFMLRIIALLNKQLSKKSINGDLRTLDDTMYVKVLAKLSKTLAKKQLKKELKELNDLYIKINAGVNINKSEKDKLQRNIRALQQSITDLQIGLKMSQSQQDKIRTNIRTIRNKAQKDMERNPISFNLQIRRDKLISELEYMGKRYGKLFSNASASQKYEQIMSNAFRASNKLQLADVKAELETFTNELKMNGLATQSTSDKWKQLIERSKNLFSAVTILNVVFSQLRKSVTTFVELDTAMTGVWKVSNDITSKEQFSGLLTKWNKLAQNLKVTTVSLINSIEEWSKMGFDLDMSEQLARLTTIFEKTAEISSEKANATLISAAQAFTEIGDLGEDDYVARVEAIGNRINSIGNKYAISSEGISDALQNSAAALKIANNDLDESIAMITAANKIFQSPAEIGNAMKVISARLRGQKGELEALNEDTEGMIEGVSKVQTQILNLTGNKVNIFENDNETLKSTYDILLEIGKVYSSLTDRRQAELTEILFGKQRLAAGASLLLNYKELEKVKQDSMMADNSMAEEYAKYMETAEASIISFKEKLTETYATFMSGNIIKFAAESGSAILDLINTTDLLRHSLLAVASINIGKGISAVGATIASTAKQMNVLGNALEQMKSLPLDEVLRAERLAEIGQATQGLTDKNLRLLLSQKQLTEQDRSLILKQRKLTEEEIKAKLAKMQLTSATNNQSAANVKEATTTLTLSSAMQSLKASVYGVGNAIRASFLSNPLGWILAGISTAVSIASTAMTNYKQKLEEQYEEIKQTAEESASHVKSLLELKIEVNEGTKSLEELTEAFRKQLRTMGYTETQIDTLIKKYGNLSGAIDEATREALENAKTDAYTDVSISARLLMKESKGNTDIGTYYSQNKELSEKIKQLLEDSPAVLDGGVYRLDKNASAEDVYTYYNVLKDVSQLIQETAAETNDESLLNGSFLNPTPYYQVTEALSALSESAESYGEAIGRLHNADAQLELADYLKTNNIDSKEIFDNYIEGIKANKSYSEAYKQVLLEVANDAFPQFSKAVEEVNDSIDFDKFKLLSISKTVDQINTQLKPALDSLGKAYRTIFEDTFNLENIDTVSLAKGIKDELDKLSEEGIKVDTTAYESFVATLSDTSSTTDDVKKSFDELATAIAKVSISGTEDFEVLKKSLSDLGVINHVEVAFASLINNKEALAEAGLDLATATKEEIENFAKLYVETENLSVAIQYLTYQKMRLSMEEMDTSQEVRNMIALAEQGEITGKVLEYLIYLEQTYQDISSNLLTEEELADKLNTAKHLTSLIEAEINNANYSPQVKFEPTIDTSKLEKSTKDTKSTFDWIETKLSRIQRAITNLGKTVSATYKNWSTRNNALAQEMAAVNQEIAAQQKAYEAYMNKANSVNLSESYKEKIRNGSFNIEDIADESVQENVKSYQEWYEKALECEDAITDLRDSLAELAQAKFDNIFKEYDDKIAMIEHHTSMLEGYVNRAEAAGFWASEVYYQKMAEKELENINQLQGKYNDLTNALNESIANNSVEKYSEDWYEMRIQIDDVEKALQEANTQLVEFNQTLQQIHWDLFDRASDYKDLFVEESNFLAEILSRRDLYNEVGKLTSDGLAIQGLHVVNYNTYMEQSEAFAEEILKLNEEIANDPNDLELIDRRNELIDLQQEAIENAVKEKESIISLRKEGYDVMLDSLNDLIVKRKEALNAERDLFDYQNSIKEKTDTISNYQKQLQAYSGDNSEEARATIQKLQVSLSEAQKDLQETEYDKWLSDQESLLDTFYIQTEEWINMRLDDVNGLISEAIQATNDNAITIGAVITETAETLGYTLSEYANMLWSGDNDNTTLLLKAYEDVALGVDVGTTKLETILNSIDQKIQTMVDDLNNQAVVESESIGQPDIEYNETNNYDSGNSEPQQPSSNGITFNGGTFYEDSYKGGKTGNSQNQWTGHEVEVTHESGTGMVHIVDKTTGTILGWVDKDQLQGYSTGTTNAKKGFNLVSEKGDELIKDKEGNIILARGEQVFPFKGGETVFNAAKTAELLNGNLMPLSTEQLWGNIVKVPKLPEMVNRNIGSNIKQDINVHFELPNVTDANSLITELQQSKRFEKIIQSMTADQMLGKGSFGKYKY